MRANLLLLACVVALAGCDRQKSDHTVTIAGSNGTVSMTGNGEHFAVKDANGNQTMEVNANGGGVPSNLPGFVTVYPGAKVQSSVVGNGANSTGGTIVIQSSACIADIIAYYRRRAASAGFSETMNMSTGETTMFTAGSNNKRSIEVVASTSDGATHAQIIWGGN